MVVSVSLLHVHSLVNMDDVCPNRKLDYFVCPADWNRSLPYQATLRRKRRAEQPAAQKTVLQEPEESVHRLDWTAVTADRTGQVASQDPAQEGRGRLLRGWLAGLSSSRLPRDGVLARRPRSAGVGKARTSGRPAPDSQGLPVHRHSSRTSHLPVSRMADNSETSAVFAADCEERFDFGWVGSGWPVEEHKTSLDGSGRPVEEDRTSLVGSGWPVEEHKTSLVGSGWPVEEHKTSLDGSGRPVEEHKTSLGGSGWPVEEDRTSLVGSGWPVEEHKTSLDGSGRPVEERKASLGGSGWPVEERKTSLVGSGWPVEEHKTSLDGSGRPVEERKASLGGSGWPVEERKTSLGGSGWPTHRPNSSLVASDWSIRQHGISLVGPDRQFQYRDTAVIGAVWPVKHHRNPLVEPDQNSRRNILSIKHNSTHRSKHHFQIVSNKMTGQKRSTSNPLHSKPERQRMVEEITTVPIRKTRAARTEQNSSLPVGSNESTIEEKVYQDCPFFQFRYHVWPIILFVLYAAIPVSVMVCADIAVAYKVLCKTDWTIETVTDGVINTT